MSDQQREHLSALVDGEIDDDLVRPTVSALESNPELGATWERYHLIGQCLRGEQVRLEYRGIATRVRTRVAEEPLRAPRRGNGGNRHSRLGPFVGAALAASAAFFAVFAVPQLFNAGHEEPHPALAAKAVVPTQRFELAAPGQRWQVEQPALQSKLDRFLVNHQAFAPPSGVKGFLPYATVVGYDAGR